MRALFILILSLLPICTSGPLHAAEAVPVRIGVIATRNIEGAEYSLGSTLQHLSATLPAYRFVLVNLTPDSYRQAVQNQQIDFVVGNPALYVELEATFGASRIATVEYKGGPSPSAAIGSTIFVKAGRQDLRTLADIRGKRIAAISPELFGGFRIAWRMLLEHGIDPFRDAKPDFVGEPAEKVFATVRDGRADVGIARSCILEELAATGRFDAADFMVLDGRIPEKLACRVSTALYPDWPFAKLAHTANPLAKAVAQALLAMPADRNGLSWTIPVDYQPVHDVFRALKVGPYEYLRQQTFRQVLEEYWHWAMVALLTLVFSLLSLARMRYLLRQRTAELNAACMASRREREKMEHAARLSLMGEMASSIAHEISQPLAAIVNYARGCQRRLADGSRLGDVGEGLGQVVAQAERASIIVRRMRDFVRKRPPAPADIDLNVVLAETLDFFQPFAERRGVTLTRKLEEALPSIQADRIQIEEVLLNLLQNAVDAAENGEQRAVEVSARISDKSVIISVADSGQGIDAETRERLFEAFYTTKPQGLGLGLSLSRSIVESHGGQLSGENRPGGGAVLSFSLPFDRPKPL